MNYKKKIAFLPTYDYLSNRLFLSFIDKLNDFHTIYINNDEFQKIKRDNNIVSKFSSYVEIGGGFCHKDKKNFFQKIKKVFIKNRVLQKQLLEYIKNVDPDLVITTSDMSISFKGIKKYCVKKNIPIVLLQPSFFDYEKIKKVRIKDIFHKLINIFFEFYPKQALWGNEDKDTILFLWGEFFKKFYNKEKDIRVVGNPIYDNYNFNFQSNQDKIKLKNKLGISNQKVITICTEAFGGLISKKDTRLLFEFYSKIIQSNQDIFFIIKLHPREQIKNFDLISNNCTIVKNEYDLKQIFSITDIQVSVASTSSVEAILFNIPIILINPNNTIKVNDFFNNLVELRANNIEQFKTCINTIFSKKWQKTFKSKRDNFLALYLNSLNNSSSLIKMEIENLLNNHSNSIMKRKIKEKDE